MREPPAPTGSYWNDQATVAAFAALTPPAYLTDLLDSPAPADALALDVGCGAGRNLPALIAAGYRVLAVDLHPGMLRQARKQHAGTRTTFAEANVTRLPLADQQAHLVVCHGVLHNLHHRQDVTDGLRELHRVLKPNGTLSLNTFTAAHLDPCLKTLGSDVYALPSGQHMTLLAPADLLALIRQAGLSPRGHAVEYLRPGDPGLRSVWRATLTRP